MSSPELPEAYADLEPADGVPHVVSGHLRDLSSTGFGVGGVKVLETDSNQHAHASIGDRGEPGSAGVS